MRSKIAISTIVVISLFGTTAIAAAQTTPAPGASSEGNVGPGATGPGSKTKAGMTGSGATTGTGMTGSRKGDAAQRNPSSEGNVGPGTNNNNNGPTPGGK